MASHHKYVSDRPMRSRHPLVAPLALLLLAASSPALAAAQAPAPPILLANATPTEHAVRTPLPVYVELADDPATTVARVWLRYQPLDASAYLRVELPPLGRGYGVELPCDVALREGPVRYYLEMEDAEGREVGQIASEQDPLTVAIVSEPSGEPAALPGHPPPTPCRVLPPPEPPVVEPPRYQLTLLGTADSMVMAQGATDGFTAGRAVLGCERWLWKTAPVSAGVRFGYAFDGGPSDDPRSLAYERGFSVEGRVAVHPRGLWARRAVDPFFFVGGGVARARTPPPLTLGGPGFVSTGLGANFTLFDGLGIAAELSLLFYVPELAFVIAPSAGPTFRF